MTTASVSLPASLQTLIDSRLDTVDRMLLGRVSRADRLAIVRDLETQIYDLLQEREDDEPTREDVLAVLARLDPPEAYLPDEDDGAEPTRTATPHRVLAPARRRPDLRVARASGILGLSALGLFLLSPIVLVFSELLESEILLLVGGFALVVLILVAGIIGFVLGISSRREGAWPIVGMVTSVIATVLASAGGIVLLLMLLQ